MNKLSGVRTFISLCIILTVLETPAYSRSVSGGPSVRSSAIIEPYQSKPQPFWADHGRLMYGFQLGYALENHIPHDISHINMIIAQPQIGMIVWNSPHSRLPIKRFTVISEGILGDSTHPGGEMFGDALVLRFGLMPVGRLVPYIDAGSGPLHTTIDRQAAELSGNTQFLDQGGMGIQYFYKPDRALIFEYRYFHMSNAGIMPPNPGFNGSMITIGFCWLRRPRSLTMASSHHRLFYIPHFW